MIQTLNSKDGNRTIVDWRNAYSFILIGGQAMDRGFTVEGLTVTYMPRSIGVGNADTIQQRARFFGYKKSYLGFCRVFLDEEAYRAYVDYVHHEEDMRERLHLHKLSGKALNEWYREVRLTGELNLARPSVFSKEFERTALSAEWLTTKKPYLENNVISVNKNVVEKFLSTFKFDITNKTPHLNTKLIDVYDDLLNQLKFTSDKDNKDYSALLYTLEKQIEDNPDEECTIFLMSNFSKPRVRTLYDNGEINQLFQGESSNYVGDREIKGSGITFQIHILNLEYEDKIVYTNVTALATFIPEYVSEGIIRWA